MTTLNYLVSNLLIMLKLKYEKTKNVSFYG
jgi:hypothetical protein